MDDTDKLIGLTDHSKSIFANACIGNNGGPYDSKAYAKGFSVAALRLLETFEDQTYKDLIIYPIFTCYVNSLKLHMNHLIDISNRYLDSEVSGDKGLMILDLWNQLRTNLLNLGDDIEGLDKDLVNVSAIVDELTTIDPSGNSFLYPKEMNNNNMLDRHNFINTKVLSNQLNYLTRVFANWESTIYRLSEDAILTD